MGKQNIPPFPFFGGGKTVFLRTLSFCLRDSSPFCNGDFAPSALPSALHQRCYQPYRGDSPEPHPFIVFTSFEKQGHLRVLLLRQDRTCPFSYELHLSIVFFSPGICMPKLKNPCHFVFLSYYEVS